MRFSASTTAERILPSRLAERVRPLLERIDAALFASDTTGAAGRMSLAAFFIRIVNALIAFGSQVLLARWMGGFEYGIFVLVWVTMIIVANLSCLGTHTVVIRFVPQYLANENHAKLRGILLASRLFAFLLSCGVTLAGITGLWFFSPRIEAYYLVPFYLGVICVPMMALTDVLEGIARANSWVFSALLPTYLFRPVLILVFMVAALTAGFPASAETAITAAILATYITAVGQLAAVSGRAEKRVPPGPRTYEPVNWLVVSMPIFLIEGFFFLLVNADVLMIGYFMSPGDVAVYFAAVKTLAVVHFVYFAVKAGVAQRYAHFAHSDNQARFKRFVRETVSWTFWPSVLVGVVVLVLGEVLLGLFGNEFRYGYPLLFVLIVGIIARAAVGPAESVLTMSGNQNTCAAVYAAALAVNLCLNVLLIPLYGLWGAAAATSVAMTFESAALAITVWRRLGIIMVVFTPSSTARKSG